LKSVNLIQIIYLDELKDLVLNEYPLNLLKILIAKESEIQNLLNDIGNNLQTKVRDKEEKEKIQDLTINLLMAKITKLTIEELTKMLKPIIRDIRKSRAARQLIHEGKMEGKLEGKMEGKMEGKLEGKMEGKLEGKMETARRMHGKGVPKNQIIEFTGLKKEDLKDLK
jgi:predicted transposase/invertase (TIGR01784 family)